MAKCDSDEKCVSVALFCYVSFEIDKRNTRNHVSLRITNEKKKNKIRKTRVLVFDEFKPIHIQS